LRREVANLMVDVIFTSWGTPTALAARNATQTIPVVFTGVGDAIGVGLVSSLSRPGGNVTGLTIISETTVGKQLELLKEAVPNITRVAVLSNPSNPVYGPVLKDVEIMGRTLDIQIVRIGVRDESEFDRALDTARSDRAGGLVVLRDPVFVNQVGLLNAVSRNRLPAIYGLREAVDGGGLMSFGPNLIDMYRRAAFYVDKILKGTKAGDLPVEQASRFELVINLKTAKALGITVPSTLLARADEVIE
jgi:putative tryptophan/tyrosine transport system substrate-binding protein